MFRTNWKKWSLVAALSAALLPVATFAKTHGATAPAKQPVVTKTSTADSTTHKKKLAHHTAPAKKLVHKATPSKKLTSNLPASKKLASISTAPKKLTSKHIVTKKLTTKKVAPKKLTTKTAHQPTKTLTHKKIALSAKGKTVKA
jgi:hypothetical protein